MGTLSAPESFPHDFLSMFQRPPNSRNAAARRRAESGRATVRRRPRIERLDDRRVLAAITGVVFHDLNQSLHQESGEPFAANRLVFLDSNANATLDVGEPLRIADDAGAFSFQGLSDGTYEVRVFDGTTSQQQTFPVDAEIGRAPIAIAGGTALLAAGGNDSAGNNSVGINIVNGGRVLTADSIVDADLDTATTSTIALGSSLAPGSSLIRAQALPDGRLLVIGGETSSSDTTASDATATDTTATDTTATHTAWIVGADSATPVDLSVSGATAGNVDLAIDGNGRGVLLVTAQDQSSVLVRSIDATDVSGAIVVRDTGVSVPLASTVLASSTGGRSVIASPSAEGLVVSLWSNSTGTPIAVSSDVAGAVGLVAFDDASGIVVLATAGGGVSIHDVNDEFRQVDQIGGSIGAVMIDPLRDLWIAYDNDAAALRIISLRDGARIATLPVDVSAVGDVVSLAGGSQPDSFLVLGSAGIAEIKLNRPAAHRVTIVGGMDADPIAFGVVIIDANTPPRYVAMPTLSVDEDDTLNLGTGATLVGSIDANDDDYVLVQQTGAANGVATLNIDGSIQYVPDDDFFGTDTVTVVLHDGQNVSDPIVLNIEVRATPDPLVDVVVNVNPTAENAPVGLPIGGIRIVDVDGGGHLIEINDPRFGAVPNVNGGIDIVVLGGPIDFETETLIPLDITVSDPETSDVIVRNVSLRITDANDPITAILPAEAFVIENAPGDVVTGLTVVDQDAEQSYTFTVDDDRFIVQEFDLRLADGVAVDFESESTITVNVTATEVGAGGNSFTQSITITVRDVAEQPTGLTLTDRVVMEFTAGDQAGRIQIDGSDPDPRYLFTVDDPRFEVVDGTLKLRNRDFVVQAVESQIELTITVQDSVGQFATIDRSFVIEVLENETPLHNRDNPFDVNHGGDVTAADALAIINYLSNHGPGPVGAGDVGFCYDVNADGFVTALDALLVINRLNQNPSVLAGGEAEGEGELVPASTPQTPPQAPLQQRGLQQRGLRLVDGDDGVDGAGIVNETRVGEVVRDATFAAWRPSIESDVVADAIESLNDADDSDDGSLDLLTDRSV